MYEKKCKLCGEMVSLGDYISHAGEKHHTEKEECFEYWS